MDDAYTEQVLRLVEAVPEGSVTTYGDLAEMVGRGGPRQVGAVMSRHGGGVPWWRVVRADGRPADGLTERALRRLADEGVPVVDGRVRMASARWQPTPESLADHHFQAGPDVIGASTNAGVRRSQPDDLVPG